MLLPNNFLGAVTSDGREVIIYRRDVAIEVKFNHAHDFANGVNLSGGVCIPTFVCSNIRRIFNDFEWLAICIKNRVVARLQPDFFAAFACALVLAFV